MIVLGYGVEAPFVVAGAPLGIVIAAEFVNVAGGTLGDPNLKLLAVEPVPAPGETTLIVTLWKLPQAAFAGTV